ncbi:26286_t:CDS:2 [Dentiscutata erythropus]|uniref:26286_t:CDS:1 n=1 Tax=Dentiscutata erythropus TaxID=1348616 RepID=A0A9N9FV14_9GLOM|nr:26286_t:CDS:2 [Dentiscutata erythropus]
MQTINTSNKHQQRIATKPLSKEPKKEKAQELICKLPTSAINTNNK